LAVYRISRYDRGPPSPSRTYDNAVDCTRGALETYLRTRPWFDESLWYGL